jgi:hypothetical protein
MVRHFPPFPPSINEIQLSHFNCSQLALFFICYLGHGPWRMATYAYAYAYGYGNHCHFHLNLPQI